VIETSGGHDLKSLARGIVEALKVGSGETAIVDDVKPLANPALRNLLLDLRRKADLVIDIVTQDTLLEAGFSAAAAERAKSLVQTFEAFIAQHKDEITALQILYNRPVKAPLKFEDVKALADALHAPPYLLSESALWQAYATLDQSKVGGGGTARILTDLVSLVRFAMHQENELVPYPERVAANLRLDLDDFEYAPFNKEGGLGRVHQLFGAELPQVIETLNLALAT
jgi:type I restriction enzyme R subunit